MVSRMTHFSGNGEISGLTPDAQLFTTKGGRKHTEPTLTEYTHSAGCSGTLSPRWLSLQGWGSSSRFRIVSSVPGVRKQLPYWHLFLILLPDSPFRIQRQQRIQVTQLCQVPVLPPALQAPPRGMGITPTLPSGVHTTPAQGLPPPTECSLLASGMTGTTVFPPSRTVLPPRGQLPGQSQPAASVGTELRIAFISLTRGGRNPEKSDVL